MDRILKDWRKRYMKYNKQKTRLVIEIVANIHPLCQSLFDFEQQGKRTFQLEIFIYHYACFKNPKGDTFLVQRVGIKNCIGNLSLALYFWMCSCCLAQSLWKKQTWYYMSTGNFCVDSLPFVKSLPEVKIIVLQSTRLESCATRTYTDSNITVAANLSSRKKEGYLLLT